MDIASVEWFAAGTGLISVILTVRRNLACWPIGIVSVLAFGVLFWQLKLYADAGLQGFFLITSLFGWWHWAHGGPDYGKAPIRVLASGQRVWGGLALLGGTGTLGWILWRHTDASLPFWDALASGFSVAAQVLLMRKFLDSWYVWIAVDVLSIGIYSAKDAWVTCALYAVFLMLATFGLIAWKRALRRGETV